MGMLKDGEGRPYEWSIRMSEPHVSEESRFFAGFATWEGGAVVMTRAIPAAHNPTQPVDRMVIVPVPGTVIVIDYIGEGD